MKRILIAFLSLLSVGAGSAPAEIVRLRDGSVIKARSVTMDADSVYLETFFGSKVAVPKQSVARIDFDESAPSGPGPASPGGGAPDEAPPGTLAVTFEDFKLTSRVIVGRGRDRETCEKENAIELALVVDGAKVFSTTDSLTDKTVRKGPETVLRNDLKPRDFEVILPAGIHRCVVAFGNAGASACVEFFDPAPLDKKLVLDPVRIDPGKTTRVRIGMKRKWTGKTELTRIE